MTGRHGGAARAAGQLARRHLPAPALRALRAAKRHGRILWLTGWNVECPVCGGHFRHFVEVPPGAKMLCPRCLSLDRHRRIVLFLRRSTNIYRDPLRVLHVGPEPGLRHELERLPNLDYVTGDLYAGDVDVRLDVTAIAFPDETFDVILCSHVLEHVPDDRRAMRELRRVLKRDGWALINAPSEPGRSQIYEDDSVVDPAQRLRHFGQEDHVRLYSTEGFLGRLHEAGFEVRRDPLAFSMYERARYVLYGDGGWDHSYLCHRGDAPVDDERRGGSR